MMTQRFRARGLSLLLALTVLLSLSATASAANTADLLEETAQYIRQTVSDPQVASIGGEWAVLGLARSGCSVPDTYYETYYNTVKTYTAAHKGVLHDKKYSEYSRVILALTALGKDPRNVAGYDLTKPLGDYEKTVWQGLNGPIWALMALDAGNYPMPQNADAKTQATRQMYVDHILSHQLEDGGWSLTGKAPADPDLTGMALQALAKYQAQSAVSAAIEKALDGMSRQQSEDGGFRSWGTPNSESCAQMLVALCELGLSPNDARFVKNGNTLLDGFLSYRLSDGSFRHTLAGSANLMATEQGLYVLAALRRAETGKPSLYRMTDPLSLDGGSEGGGQGLPGKHADVKGSPITSPGKTFPDIAGHTNQTAIEALSSRGIINGMDDTRFAPNETMTRAQFAAIVVRGLGLPQKAVTVFQDVKPTDWHAAYVGSASTYGIVSGRSAKVFDPDGTITRQEAALMVARAAKLCGMDTDLDDATVRDTLAQFTDYVTADAWARAGLAFCYRQDILDDTALEIRPKAPILRCEIAQMLYHLLGSAQLL